MARRSQRLTRQGRGFVSRNPLRVVLGGAFAALILVLAFGMNASAHRGALAVCGGSFSTPGGSFSTPCPDPPFVTLDTPSNNALINNAEPTFSGTASTAAFDNSTVTVEIFSSDSGNLVQTLTTTQSGGSYSVTPTAALPDGAYTARASQSDQFGQTGYSNERNFTVDATPPVVSLSTPARSFTNDNTVLFSGSAGTAPGDQSPIKIAIYPGSAVSGNAETLLVGATGNFYSATAYLPDGTYTVQASQSDTAGNVGYSWAITFTVTTHAGSTTVVAGTGQGGSNTAASALSAPVLWDLRASRQCVRAAHLLGSAIPGPGGLSFAYSLNENAVVTFAISRHRGSRARKTCPVHQAPGLYQSVATLVGQGQPGHNTDSTATTASLPSGLGLGGVRVHARHGRGHVRVAAITNGHVLQPGTYVLHVRATNAAGLVSNILRVKFWVLTAP